eukprot:403364012
MDIISQQLENRFQDQPSYTLTSGHVMPLIGLGTDKIFTDEVIVNAVIKAGYRTLDTASRYQNEEVIGRAIKQITANSSITRDQLFVVTKVWMDEIEDVETACKRSLEKLQLDYIDLYLLHWPVFTKVDVPSEPDQGKAASYKKLNIPIHKVWPQLEALVKQGLVRSIGVSNFCVQSLWDLLSYAEIPPTVNEIEIHPLYPQHDLVHFCLSNKILPIAYSPIARAATTEKKRGTDNVLEQEIIQKLAKKYNKTPAQIVLGWGIQRGYGIIPKSSNLERQRENFEVFDFKLEVSEMDEIAMLDRGQKIHKRDEFVFGFNIFA